MKRTTVTELLLQELPEDHVLPRIPSRELRRIAANLAEVLADYARTEQEATSPPVSTRERRGDRSSDLRASMIGKACDIREFHRAYFAVRRDRGQEILIEVRSTVLKEARIRG